MGRTFYHTIFIITLLLLAGCANAGKDKTVLFGEKVTLDANASTSNVGGNITEYHWLQIVGPTVELDESESMHPSFTAPEKKEGNQKLIFKLTTVETGGDPKRFVSFDFVKISVKATYDNNESNESNKTKDTVIPVLTLNGDQNISIKLHDTYVDEGATAEDEQDGNITRRIRTFNPVDTNQTGDYIITYNVTDKSGNKAKELTRNVHVSGE